MPLSSASDEGAAPTSAAPAPPREVERLGELRSYAILDTLPEQAYDDITYLASQICDTPIALVSLVDEDRQWFKSRVGLDAPETSRDLAFCAHAILEPESLMVVPDALEDDRFAENPLVTSDPSIRFYAGAPLTTESGNALGTLCIIDREPRAMTDDQKVALRALARQVMAQLELRASVAELKQAAARQGAYEQQLEDYQRKLEDSLASVSEQSLNDPLTGLRNRRAFGDRLHEEASRCRRSGSPLSLAMIDIDAFKLYNDRYGHPAADVVLARVAELVRKASRAHDTVARYGGEEFMIILPDTDAEAAYVVGERIRRAVERAQWPEIPVTVSVGVATAAGEAISELELTERADQLMYAAKERGRNAVVSG